MTKKCVVCNKVFTLKKIVRDKQIYCTLKCRSKDYYNKYYEHFTWKVEIECTYCKKRFLKNSVKQVQCSLNCTKMIYKKRNWEETKRKNNEWVKQDRLKRPEYYRQFIRNRRALKRSSSSKGLSLEEWEEIKEKYNHTCLKCKKSGLKLTMDHVIPLSKGGKHEYENIQPLCHSCNSGKKDREIDYRYFIADNTL